MCATNSPRSREAVSRPVCNDSTDGKTDQPSVVFIFKRLLFSSMNWRICSA
jgi:hypothetical protein